MASPYRNKWFPESNVPRDTRISGEFGITASTGAPTTLVRPSAGSGATAGQGNLFTVTQLSTYNSGTNAAAYQITFTENYLKHVFTDAGVSFPFSLTTPATGQQTTAVSISQYDATTNSIVLVLSNGTTGTMLQGATVPACNVMFEACFINTTSPNSL